MEDIVPVEGKAIVAKTKPEVISAGVALLTIIAIVKVAISRVQSFFIELRSQTV